MTAPPEAQAPDEALLEVRGLTVEFRTTKGIAHAVNGVDLDVRAGRTLAVLGESGSGKSVTAQAIMGILDCPPAFVTGGTVRFAGTELLSLPESERRKYRGAEIAMIFQDALSALNPVLTVGEQVAETLRAHRGMSSKVARERAVELLDHVQIPAARQRLGSYPHELSGGMRQRVMIAIALSCAPRVLIADEPTTALDVTVQAQIMQLLADLQQDTQMGLVLITHDLGVVADVSDEIAVMYAGRIVERAPVFDLYSHPAHPYTKGLLDSVPRLGAFEAAGHPGREMASREILSRERPGRVKLRAIPGMPPSLLAIPPGCPFHPRCPYVQPVCRVDRPPLGDLGQGRASACWFASEVRDGLLS